MGFTAQYSTQEPARAEIDDSTGPVVVEFGAPWCPHCQIVQPILAELLDRFSNVRHIKIYDGKGKPLGRSFRVKLWPNLVFIRDGKVLMQLARPDEDEIREGFRVLAAESTPR